MVDRAGHDGAEGRVGRDAGQPGGYDHLRLEGRRPVKHLGGEQRPGQGRPEDGGNPCPHAGRHQDAALDRAQTQEVGQERTEAGPDLGNRPFSPPRATQADCQCTGDDLDQRYPRADLPLVAMVGGDDRIGAVPLCLGSEAKDQQPAKDASQGRHNQEQPGAERIRRLGQPGRERLVAGVPRVVADDAFQSIVNS